MPLMPAEEEAAATEIASPLSQLLAQPPISGCSPCALRVQCQKNRSIFPLKQIPFALLVLIAGLSLAACSNGASSSSIPYSPGARKVSSFSPLSSGSSPISHIVLIVQENRTMNNFFATFPGANGSTTGYELVT